MRSPLRFSSIKQVHIEICDIAIKYDGQKVWSNLHHARAKQVNGMCCEYLNALTCNVPPQIYDPSTEYDDDILGDTIDEPIILGSVGANSRGSAVTDLVDDHTRPSLQSAFGTQPLPDALPVAHPHSSQLTQETNEMHAATASDWHSHSHDVKCVDRQPIDYHKTADDIMSNWIKPSSILMSGNGTAVADPLTATVLCCGILSLGPISKI